MNDNELSMLRYSLKQCEKSLMDARDNPRYWEQAFLNSDGLLAKLTNLPADERLVWENKLHEWLPQMRAGANRAVGERILRRINDGLASAASRLAEDGDPASDFDRLERELAHADTLECVPEAERSRAVKELADMQHLLAQKAIEHRVAAALDRMAYAEEKLVELEAAVKHHPDGSNVHLARVLAGNFDTVQAELDELDELAQIPAEHERLALQLQRLRQRFDAL